MTEQPAAPLTPRRMARNAARTYLARLREHL